jgi:hypothetical protein
MTLRTNAQVAGFTYWIYFAAGIGGLLLAVNTPATAVLSLVIASIAFFLGRGRVPAAIRTPPLIATGVLLPIVAMAYWLWRIRIRKTFLGIVGVSTPLVTGATK